VIEARLKRAKHCRFILKAVEKTTDKDF